MSLSSCSTLCFHCHSFLPSSFSLPLSLQFSQHILHIGTKDFFARQLKQLTENVALRKDMAKVEQQQLMPCDATSINVSTTRECLPVCVCGCVCVPVCVLANCIAYAQQQESIMRENGAVCNVKTRCERAISFHLHSIFSQRFHRAKHSLSARHLALFAALYEYVQG